MRITGQVTAVGKTGHRWVEGLQHPGTCRWATVSTTVPVLCIC